MTFEQTKNQFLLAYSSNAYLNICESDDMHNVIVALNKQIPQKPVITVHKYLDDATRKEGKYKLKHCPCCWENEKLGYFESLVDKGTKHCHRCGQALDWSDTE